MLKNEYGVSPVIATILLVAITVVLAATIYITIVTGMFGTPSSTSQLICTLTIDQQHSNMRHLNLTITMTNPTNALFENVRIGVSHNGKYALLKYSATNHLWSNRTSNGRWHFEARISDNDNNGKLNSGDTLYVYIVDDNPSDGVAPPYFKSGDSIKLSIMGYNGVASVVIS